MLSPVRGCVIEISFKYMVLQVLNIVVMANSVGSDRILICQFVILSLRVFFCEGAALVVFIYQNTIIFSSLFIKNTILFLFNTQSSVMSYPLSDE